MPLQAQELARKGRLHTTDAGHRPTRPTAAAPPLPLRRARNAQYVARSVY